MQGAGIKETTGYNDSTMYNARKDAWEGNREATRCDKDTWQFQISISEIMSTKYLSIT